MKTNKLFTCVLLFSVLFLNSCYTTTKISAGNIHQSSIGKTKNEILRLYGTPNRTVEDGAGGTILIYEKLPGTTQDNSDSTIYGLDVQRGSINAANGTRNTTADKIYYYCNLYLNKKDIVYDYKTNYGDQYTYEKNINQGKTAAVVIGVAGLIAGIYLLSTIFN